MFFYIKNTQKTILKMRLYKFICGAFSKPHLGFGNFSTEERNGHDTLSYHCSQLHCGGISVYLKRLCKVQVDQYYLFGDGSLDVVKCLLMDRIPPT